MKLREVTQIDIDIMGHCDVLQPGQEMRRMLWHVHAKVLAGQKRDAKEGAKWTTN